MKKETEIGKKNRKIQKHFEAGKKKKSKITILAFLLKIH